MALARFNKICLDAAEPANLGRFWAAALHQSWEPDPSGEGAVVDQAGRVALWLNQATGPKKVKHRAHLDIYAASLADLEALGASVVLPEGDGRRWTVMIDPEDGEFCAFLRDEPPEQRLHGLVVDCGDYAAQGRFWHQLLGGQLEVQPEGYSELSDVPGMAFTFDFVPVPEPKTVPNRVHWDLIAPDVAPIVAAGATVLRTPDEEIDWHVLQDPEGNEFCVVVRPDEVA